MDLSGDGFEEVWRLQWLMVGGSFDGSGAFEAKFFSSFLSFENTTYNNVGLCFLWCLQINDECCLLIVS
ncbi:unnamed protein product [Lathyrus sativus]|nr:unnamed protein product [Lathyrus sativus]